MKLYQNVKMPGDIIECGCGLLSAYEAARRLGAVDFEHPAEFVAHVRITAPDYRRPTETSNPGISMLSLPEMKVMTFRNFETREDELGKEAVTTTTTEKQDRFGNKV